MIYIITIIILLTSIMFLILKDIYKVLKITSIITITSGYITILLGNIITNIINNKISFINISKITDIIFNKNLQKGLILILIGATELILYIIILIYKNYLKRNKELRAI